MGPLQNMVYEGFIRSAFSVAESEMIGRGGDPAQLADADYFSDNYLNQVKVGIAYSMEIFKTELINGSYGLSEEEIKSLDLFMDRVIRSQNIAEIYNLITSYKKEFVDKYIEFTWQK